MIEIVEYQPAWPTEFALLAERLHGALGPLALRIDHIGSTAVPGLAAKDVIDLQVTVAAFSNELVEVIESLGYQIVQENSRDHVPPGFNGPASEWEKMYARSPAGERKSNTHIRIEGRANQRYPLIFRDYLRTHPLMAEAYARLKRKLAEAFDDTMIYADVKDPAVDLIWLAALQEMEEGEET